MTRDGGVPDDGEVVASDGEVVASDGEVVASDGAALVTAIAAGLREAGVQVATGQVITCGQALAAIAPDDLGDRYWAGRLTLLSDRADVATYDRVFATVVAGLAAGEPVDVGPQDQDEVAVVADGGVDAGSDRGDPDGADDGDEVAAGGLASVRERLRHRRFADATAEERAQLDAAIAALRVAVPHRASRRTTAGRRGDLDLPRTLERALANDGELIDRAWQQRRRRPRPLVVLLDVSGSMAGYARAMLRFAAAARAASQGQPGRHVEVFAFGTRLTRLTDALSARDADAAITAAAAAVVDWDGGTLIGRNLDRLVRVWGRRGVLRGAVVVVCSDGLERGDPHDLAVAVARLRRSVHRLVWVNPLAGDPRYEPTQRGMRAALPFVDVFLPGHDLASLEDLAEVLATLR